MHLIATGPATLPVVAVALRWHRAVRRSRTIHFADAPIAQPAADVSVIVNDRAHGVGKPVIAASCSGR